jgi:ferredoxin-NADP reductase/predicted pyridoxine 5'-phosphate oxidase superfamily flavin-nucleotide-binding protein
METAQFDAASPFHAGEHEVQERLGIRDKMEAFGRRVIRDHMPDQHREFYAMLPFVLIGSVDDDGWPWASIVTGRPGFLSTPDTRTLRVSGPLLYGDPLAKTLKPGAPVGVLGIQPETRRRNRLTGRISEADADGFSIAIDQSFGNCPQYIQARDTEILPTIDTPGAPRPVRRLEHFDPAVRGVIENADTLFVATCYEPTTHPEGEQAAALGADVSHRGGKPGFVRIEDERTFIFPDFAGNYHFNTVGNMMRNPRAGYLFIDFESGDLVYLTGETEIVWDGPELHAFVGAERLIRFRAREVLHVAASLSLRFAFQEYSPLLDQTGSWQQAEDIIATESERNRYTRFEVADIRRESETIKSFYLQRADGKTISPSEPGQHLPIRVAIPGDDNKPALRTYTVSDAPGREHYRLSIKREDTGLVSRHFHDRLRAGDQIEAMAPRGKFVLDRSSMRPVVLVSAGVGITPMIAMANFIVDESARTGQFRRTFFIHGARNGRSHAFANHVRELATAHEGLTVHTRYSSPRPEDRLGKTYDSEGRVDVALLKQVLPLDDYDFYLCGPAGFMREMFEGLTELGIRPERIRYESFGPATVLAPAEATAAEAAPVVLSDPVKVHFAKSKIDATWSSDVGTLLDLAEVNGIDAAFSCRSGICGTCATRIACGAVDYLDEPSAPHDGGEVLICCATPRVAAGSNTGGDDRGVVLDL